jgi:DNA-binding response OmpR family regulator
MKPANILVIEDDWIVGRTISRTLQGDEFKVTIANTGVEGLKTSRRYPPDLVILDVIMPGMDGFTVCKEIRADPLLADIPILFLTAKAKEEDRIEGFKAGADDYLAKPFNIDELILRVRAILRRTRALKKQTMGEPSTKTGLSEIIPRVTAMFQGKGTPDQEEEVSHRIVIREYILDTRSFELHTPHDGQVLLTPVQFDLLYHLMSHPGHVFSPTRLLEEVWDYPSDSGSPDLVRVHIKNLRQRVEKNPRSPSFIRTVPGYGYTIGEN